MNRLVSLPLRSVSAMASQTMTLRVASFATAKEKDDGAKAKSKKGSKSETANLDRQVKSLVKHYYKMRTYEPPKLSEEKQKEYMEAAKEYSRQMTRIHHYYEQRLNDKIFLRDLAISALPTEALREQAKKTDPEQIPGKYFYPARKARFEDLSKELAWWLVCWTSWRVRVRMCIIGWLYLVVLKCVVDRAHQQGSRIDGVIMRIYGIPYNWVILEVEAKRICFLFTSLCCIWLNVYLWQRKWKSGQVGCVLPVFICFLYIYLILTLKMLVAVRNQSK